MVTDSLSIINTYKYRNNKNIHMRLVPPNTCFTALNYIRSFIYSSTTKVAISSSQLIQPSLFESISSNICSTILSFNSPSTVRKERKKGRVLSIRSHNSKSNALPGIVLLESREENDINIFRCDSISTRGICHTANTGLQCFLKLTCHTAHTGLQCILKI